MSRRARAILFVFFTLVLAGVVVWLALGHREYQPTDPHESARDAVTGDNTPSDGTADVVKGNKWAADPDQASAPVFPAGADPAAVISALLPAARAGDPAAACRVALERLACDAAQHQRDDMLAAFRAEEERAARQSRGNDDADMARLLARKAERYADYQVALIERGAACARVPPSLRDDGIDWLARAAATGHAESVLRYATGQSLGFVEGLEPDESVRWQLLGQPHFEAWRRDAPVLLQGMIDAGRPEAAFVLFFAYSEDATPLGGLLRDDPVEAAAMRLLMRDSSPNPTHSDPLRALDAIQRQTATSRFAQLRTRLGGGRMDRRLLEDSLEPAPLSLIGAREGTPPPCRI